LKKKIKITKIKRKKGKVIKKKREALWITTQCFMCGGTVIPPHHLEYVVKN